MGGGGGGEEEKERDEGNIVETLFPSKRDPMMLLEMLRLSAAPPDAKGSGRKEG